MTIFLAKLAREEEAPSGNARETRAVHSAECEITLRATSGRDATSRQQRSFRAGFRHGIIFRGFSYGLPKITKYITMNEKLLNRLNRVWRINIVSHMGGLLCTKYKSKCKYNAAARSNLQLSCILIRCSVSADDNKLKFHF